MHLGSSNRENFPYYQHISYFLVIPLCVHVHEEDPRVPPQVLASGPKPCGGNKKIYQDIYTNKIGSRKIHKTYCIQVIEDEIDNNR